MINQTWKSKADISNPKWKYRPSFDTNVKRTIARVKREMAEIAQVNLQLIAKAKKAKK